jgi:hypothetical protein
MLSAKSRNHQLVDWAGWDPVTGSGKEVNKTEFVPTEK